MSSETMSFGADVEKILDMVARSLYSNPEIFLRELISNSSDALEKWRFERLTDVNDSDNSDGEIVIEFDKTNKTITISDNGVGMSRQELIDNLGTIARSGTQKFLEAISDKQSGLIGQFGVGFYSGFMVAHRMVVDSVKHGSTEAWRWESDGRGSFDISSTNAQFSRGTKITLHMRDEATDEYLDRYRLEKIISQYSNHIRFPIMLTDEKEGDDGQRKRERINDGNALWTKDKSQITEEEHADFFRSVAHVGGSPWIVMHNRNESRDVNFINLLYIPSIKPFDLFHPDRRCSVKLYVKGVFITEDNDKVSMLPRYMRFVKGIIDSDDVPLNVNRDSLQQNSKMNFISASVTKRILGELKKVAAKDAEKYAQFWGNFGAVLKEGLCEAMDTESRESLLSVCRFRSTTHELTSIDEYIGRMKDDQKFIYYLIGDDLDSLMNSPQIEGFINSGVEVILTSDSVDDFWTHVIYDYKDKQFKSATSSALDAPDAVNAEDREDDAAEKSSESSSGEEQMDKLVEYMKSVLGMSVANVIISKKLTSSPACLAIPEGAFNMRMERFLIDQKQLDQRRAKIMEINKKHQVITKMMARLAQEGANDELESYVHALFDAVCIAEGEPIRDMIGYSRRSVELLSKVV